MATSPLAVREVTSRRCCLNGDPEGKKGAEMDGVEGNSIMDRGNGMCKGPKMRRKWQVSCSTRSSELSSVGVESCPEPGHTGPREAQTFTVIGHN